MRLIDADVAYKAIADYYHHRTETQFKALKEAFSRVPTVKESGMYQCFNCGQYAVIWMNDFDFEDYGIDGKGIVHVCHCTNCDADIEYYCPIEESNEVQ